MCFKALHSIVHVPTSLCVNSYQQMERAFSKKDGAIYFFYILNNAVMKSF